MRRKHWKQAALIILVMGMNIFLAAGCGREEEAKTEKTSKQKQNTYTFRDVLGKEYEVPLLDKVPLNTYDYARLTEKNGFRYYTDEQGNKISKIGIDVSEYQPQADWQQVKKSGVEFVIVRVGYRGYGESGKLVEDAMFRQHIEGALLAGLDVGVYFFSQAVNDSEVKEEAEFVLERIKDYDISCPVVFDTEEIKNDTARTDHVSKEQFTQNCVLFSKAVEKAGYEPMIYANMKWMAFTLELTELTDIPKWYADYEEKPQCPYEISMWQYSESGQVPGIEGNVDLNVWFP